ncbi:MAG: peptide chain release factor 3, partial [Bacteroidota bacterium]
GAKAIYDAANYQIACWIHCDDPIALKAFENRRKNNLATDKDGNLVYLAETQWTLKMAEDNHPEIEFRRSSE